MSDIVERLPGATPSMRDASLDYGEGYRAGYEAAYRACVVAVDKALEEYRSIRKALRNIAPVLLLALPVTLEALS